MAVIPFRDVEDLVRTFGRHGATRVLCKLLVENDNTKQQVYLGSSFDVLKYIPYERVGAESEVKRPNFKAPLRFFWLDALNQPERALGTQLILYPDYPEVRLSGFLRGCTRAPNEFMRPTPKHLRRGKGHPDGRVLCLGITNDDRVLAYLAERGDSVAEQLIDRINKSELDQDGVFYSITPHSSLSSKIALISALRTICGPDWHPAERMTANGTCIPHLGQNACGYTLEALLRIIPNGKPEPDFMGWELKTLKKSRVTLMTPQPDGGLYHEHGLRWFVDQYGGRTKKGGLGFNGSHKVGEQQKKTKLTLLLTGFDIKSAKIVDVNGAIELLDQDNRLAATWSFQALLEHWGRKHHRVAFIPYKTMNKPPTHFQFQSEVHLAEGTDFRFFLKAMARGAAIYDPGCSIKNEKESKPRHQFRIAIKDLSCLYATFDTFAI